MWHWTNGRVQSENFAAVRVAASPVVLGGRSELVLWRDDSAANGGRCMPGRGVAALLHGFCAAAAFCGSTQASRVTIVVARATPPRRLNFPARPGLQNQLFLHDKKFAVFTGGMYP